MFGLKNWSLCLPVLLGLGVTACEGESGRPVYDFPTKTIWELAQGEGDLTTFVTHGETAGIATFLNDTQATYTVMAPSNSAFSGAAGLDTSPEALNALLRFHILAGHIDSALLKLGGEFRTITSTSVRVEPDGATYTVIDHLGNVAKFTKTDIYGTNGVLTIIDKVLEPPPEPVMAVCGNNMMEAGEACDDGNTADGDGCSAMCMTEMGPGTLAETLMAEGFTAVLGFIMGTPLETTLGGAGPFTVFAPNNAAINALGDTSGIDDAVLENIVLHHIVAGNESTMDLMDATTLTSLANLPLAVTANGGTVGGAPLGDKTDLEASNGVVHEVTQAIIPPDALGYVGGVMRLMQTEAAATRAGAAVAMLDPSTLTGAAPITFFAPSNMAWTVAGITDISMVETATLANILLAHATAGQVLLDDLDSGDTLTMLNGSTVEVTVAGDVITLSSGMVNAVVTRAESDRRTLSGAVHVVEALLDVDNTPN